MYIVLFGGTGFIGAHYARHLLEAYPDVQVLLCDLEPLDETRYAPVLRQALQDHRCSFLRLDVRRPIPTDLVNGPVDLIANFAAIHREPGFKSHEYWETNISGAENVTAYARAVGCKTMLFTSSISPYGVSEAARDERSPTFPSTPYGCSKLVAEKIHQVWQAESPDRRLLIVRPGVVFGAGEGGNVTRMVKFVRKGLFVYLGNRGVRKSGVFIKELCRMFSWGLQSLDDPQFCNLRPRAALFNASFDPPPSVEDYVETIKEVGGFCHPIFSVPYGLLFFASFFSFGIGGIHPVRVRKLIRPNLILPTFLKEKSYPWHWTLEQALRDWKKEFPQDWEG